MKNIPNTAPRIQIVDLVKQNAPAISRNLHTYWDRSLEDLISGGISKKAVIESMFDVAAAHCQKKIGRAALIELLRDAADYHERILLGESAEIAIPMRNRH